MDNTVSTAEMARLTGLTARRLQQLAKQGRIRRPSRGRYHPADAAVIQHNRFRLFSSERFSDQAIAFLIEEFTTGLRRLNEERGTELVDLVEDWGRGVVADLRRSG